MEGGNNPLFSLPASETGGWWKAESLPVYPPNPHIPDQNCQERSTLISQHSTTIGWTEGEHSSHHASSFLVSLGRLDGTGQQCPTVKRVSVRGNVGNTVSGSSLTVRYANFRLSAVRPSQTYTREVYRSLHGRREVYPGWCTRAYIPQGVYPAWYLGGIPCYTHHGT